jgi:deoxyribodipyrimidine photo-lyase
VQIHFPFAQKVDSVSDDELLGLESALFLDEGFRVRLSENWPSGEDHAHARMEDFVKHKSQHYHQHRDFPDKDAGSQLSPYLAIGCLSTRQCLQAALNENGGIIDDGPSGLSTWINELIWREFYSHLLADNEALCRFKPFRAETDYLPWRHDEKDFEAWKLGQTGFPIVDAAMRQLNQTGWMHNRLRMIVAMFLTKHLFIDWRWGEAYFMSKLIDGDFASNNGGWQWSASTGVDAVPYFRIFNPTRQSQRFDPQGDFIRRYVPELSHLNAKDIHQPNADQALSSGYVLPLVDHKQATGQTKLYFSQLNEGSALKYA